MGATPREELLEILNFEEKEGSDDEDESKVEVPNSPLPPRVESDEEKELLQEYTPLNAVPTVTASPCRTHIYAVVGPRSRTTAALMSQRLAGWNEHLSKLLRTFHEQSERYDWSVTATSHCTFTIGWPMREPGVTCQEQEVIFQR